LVKGLLAPISYSQLRDYAWEHIPNVPMGLALPFQYSSDGFQLALRFEGEKILVRVHHAIRLR